MKQFLEETCAKCGSQLYYDSAINETCCPNCGTENVMPKTKADVTLDVVTREVQALSDCIKSLEDKLYKELDELRDEVKQLKKQEEDC